MGRHRLPRPRRDAATDGGFTLLEVVVVVLVIGLLLAIGIPTYLGARERAQDRAAETTRRAALTTALVLHTDTLDFGDADATGLAAAEPAFTFVGSPTASDDDATVSVAVPLDGSAWGAAVRSDSGRCFFVRVDAAGTTLRDSSTTAACTGATALTLSSAPPPSLTNVAAGASATSTFDHYPDQAGDEAFDGDRTSITSRWVSAIATPTVQPSLTVDLGAVVSVSELHMWNGWRGYNNPFPGYVVDYWDPSSGTWRVLYERTDNTDAVIVETFPPVDTSQLRITITEGRARLYEVEVIGA